MRVGKPEYEAETRSPEIALLPAVTEASPHHVDHVSASVVRPLESLPDGQPGIRFQVLPSGSQTTAWIQWLRCPRAPVGEALTRATTPRVRSLLSSFQKRTL